MPLIAQSRFVCFDVLTFVNVTRDLGAEERSTMAQKSLSIEWAFSEAVT